MANDMPSARTLLDLDGEISSKESYNPQGAEAKYRNRLFAEFSVAYSQATKKYTELNDRSPLEYFTRNETDSFLYVPPPKDPNDWHSRMRWSDMRDKFDALQSFLLDLSFKVEPTARDSSGKTQLAASEGMEAQLDHADLIDGAKAKNFLAAHNLYKHGTLFESVSWEKRYATEKIGRDWNPEKDGMGLPSYSSKESLAFEGIWTETLKPNRVYLADYTKPDILQQPYVFTDYVMTYSEARSLFGKWKNWKYVKPFDQTCDGWTDSEMDMEKESTDKFDRVRVRVFKALPSDEYAICINRVLMTPPGLRLPERGTYGLALTQAGVFDPHFALGRSFFASMRPYALMGDVLKNALIDKTRQLTDPPLQSKFRVMLSKYVSRPGTVVAAQGGSLEQLFPDNGAFGNFMFEAIKLLDASIEKSSIPNVMLGSNAKGQQTKYQVQQDLMNGIRTMGSWVFADIRRREAKALEMSRLILRRYPEMESFKAGADGLRTFVSKNAEGNETEVTFGDMPTDRGAILKMKKGLHDNARSDAQAGNGKRRVFFDPAMARELKWSFAFKAVPQQQSTKDSVVSEAERKAVMYMNLGMDPQAVQKQLLRAEGDDPAEFAAKPQPAQPPQPPQGSGSPQDGAGQPTGGGMAPNITPPAQGLGGAVPMPPEMV